MPARSPRHPPQPSPRRPRGSFAGSWRSTDEPTGIGPSVPNSQLRSRMGVVAAVLRRRFVGEDRAVILVVRADAVHDRQEDAGRPEDGVDGDVQDVVTEAAAVGPSTGYVGVLQWAEQQVAGDHAEALDTGLRDD